nr:unnamed protein product [Callosobruchus analis]
MFGTDHHHIRSHTLHRVFIVLRTFTGLQQLNKLCFSWACTERDNANTLSDVETAEKYRTQSVAGKVPV